MNSSQIIASSLFFSAAMIFSQTTPSRPLPDISAYFMALPEDLFEVPSGLRSAVLKSRPQPPNSSGAGAWGTLTLDRANGFLHLSSPGWGAASQFQMALWKRPGKPDTIGIQDLVVGMDGFPESHRIVFLEYYGPGKWTDVTDSVFLKPTVDDFQPADGSPSSFSIGCQFPQRGVDIVCKAGPDAQVSVREIVMRWKDGRFQK